MAVVRLAVGPAVVDAVIDTGFDGHLQLPSSEAGSTPRTLIDTDRYGFADGSEVEFDVYLVRVSFAGADIASRAIFSPTDEALIGVKFLADYRLTIDYPAGTVTLERTRP